LSDQQLLPTRKYALFLSFLLLLSGGLLGSGGRCTTGSGGSGTSGRCTGTGTDGGQHGLDVLTVESLGEEGGPDGLDFDLGGRSEGEDLVTL
jgi:hypothetical protein